MSMFRDIIRTTTKKVRQAVAGHVEFQDWLDLGNVKMKKTQQYDSDDENRLLVDHPWGPPGVVTCWSYRFTFDSQARKRRFMDAVEKIPKQMWDDYMRWMDDRSNLNEEICVEALFRVPPDLAETVKQKFEHFLTRNLVVKL